MTIQYSGVPGQEPESPVPPVLILCGGRGERLGELTNGRPKPMVEIGDRPILWHIMTQFAQHRFTKFRLALGYLGWVVSWYFRDRVNLDPAWEVWCTPTGWNTSNGARIKTMQPHLRGTFLMAWCDGLADIDLTALLAFHRAHGKQCTVAAVQPPERFGSLSIDAHDHVVDFREKGKSSQWINAGFFVCEPGVFAYLSDGPHVQWEQDPMQRLAADGELMAYRHTGFWQCMDTQKEQRALDAMYRFGRAPWIAAPGAETVG